MEVVMAATMAPVSSKVLSLRVMAARITSSCHSKGMARSRHPLVPVGKRFHQEAAGQFADGLRYGFVGPENERYLVFQEEREFLQGRSVREASVVSRTVQSGDT